MLLINQFNNFVLIIHDGLSYLSLNHVFHCELSFLFPYYIFEHFVENKLVIIFPNWGIL